MTTDRPEQAGSPAQTTPSNSPFRSRDGAVIVVETDQMRGSRATMIDEHDAGMPDDTDTDAAYFQQRAEWHEHRAMVAKDSSSRLLHRKFAGLYHARSRS